MVAIIKSRPNANPLLYSSFIEICWILKIAANSFCLMKIWEFLVGIGFVKILTLLVITTINVWCYFGFIKL